MRRKIYPVTPGYTLLRRHFAFCRLSLGVTRCHTQIGVMRTREFWCRAASGVYITRVFGFFVLPPNDWDTWDSGAVVGCKTKNLR